MSSASDTAKQVEQAVARVLDEVPTLKQLKLVVGVDLMGRGDVQIYRVQLPGPVVTKDIASDAPVRLQIVRAKFNELAANGDVAGWRRAFKTGDAKASGPKQHLQLIERVVTRTAGRASANAAQ